MNEKQLAIATRWHGEIDSLRRQVARLEADNARLRAAEAEVWPCCGRSKGEPHAF